MSSSTPPLSPHALSFIFGGLQRLVHKLRQGIVDSCHGAAAQAADGVLATPSPICDLI